METFNIALSADRVAAIPPHIMPSLYDLGHKNATQRIISPSISSRKYNVLLAKETVCFLFL